jgi:hypothetical protein
MHGNDALLSSQMRTECFGWESREIATCVGTCVGTCSASHIHAGFMQGTNSMKHP